MQKSKALLATTFGRQCLGNSRLCKRQAHTRMACGPCSHHTWLCPAWCLEVGCRARWQKVLAGQWFPALVSCNTPWSNDCCAAVLCKPLLEMNCRRPWKTHLSRVHVLEDDAWDWSSHNGWSSSQDGWDNGWSSNGWQSSSHNGWSSHDRWSSHNGWSSNGWDWSPSNSWWQCQQDEVESVKRNSWWQCEQDEVESVE